ncbi:hypothetical protein ACTMTI_29135 [Nonomuraea sp. H19]|uniref:hypothetical protein n=1 Tax=Nonomuraea sp. H19 TaxID=3452206 RepID=UPI003F88BA28
MADGSESMVAMLSSTPALTEEGTRLDDAHHGVSGETWAQVRKHYDDDQVAALVFPVAAEEGREAWAQPSARGRANASLS